MLDKKSLGTSGGSLIHVAWNEHGPPAARAFIGVWQRVVNYWIVNRGYSIGIGDTIADAHTMDDIVETIGSLHPLHLEPFDLDVCKSAALLRAQLHLPARLSLRLLQLNLQRVQPSDQCGENSCHSGGEA